MLYTFRGASSVRDVINELVSAGYAENKSAVCRKAICEAAKRNGIEVPA